MNPKRAQCIFLYVKLPARIWLEVDNKDCQAWGFIKSIIIHTIKSHTLFTNLVILTLEREKVERLSHQSSGNQENTVGIVLEMYLKRSFGHPASWYLLQEVTVSFPCKATNDLPVLHQGWIVWDSTGNQPFLTTRRCGPLRGPSSSSCGWLRPLADTFFALQAKKDLFMSVFAQILVIFGDQ